MLKDEINISDIVRYLKSKGREENNKNAKKAVNQISIKYFNENPVNKKTKRRTFLKDTQIITRTSIITYITSIKKKKSKKIRKVLPKLREKYPIIKELEQIFHFLSNSLKTTNTRYIDNFIEKYIKHKNRRIQSFTKSINRDIKHIKNAITTGITSGFVEGGNNKIKLIKRMSYGRMNFKTLRQKILVSANYFS